MPAASASLPARPFRHLPAPGAAFDHPSRLHGPAHVGRVVFWTCVLGGRLLAGRVDLVSSRLPPLPRLNPVPTDPPADWPLAVRDRVARLAVAAALIHDLGRTHDAVCTVHGHRAAQTKRHVLETAFLTDPLDTQDWGSVARAARLHCQADFGLEAVPDDLVLGLLKDGDGLDRVRLGERFLDPAYLRLTASRELVALAADLLSASQDAWGNDCPPWSWFQAWAGEQGLALPAWAAFPDLDLPARGDQPVEDPPA